MNNHYAIIMAGGKGTRFWPYSRESMPKQFLKLFGDESMLANTVQRIRKTIPNENILIVTGKGFSEHIARTIPGLRRENILEEPVGRNTAPCIAYATMRICERQKDPIIGVFPSDHYIQDEPLFSQTVANGYDIAEKTDEFVTIGIKPYFPHTGFGYIQVSQTGTGPTFDVVKFVEKPDLALASSYLKEGNYYWNAGMFIFKSSVFNDALKTRLPKIAIAIDQLKNHPESDSDHASVLDAVYRSIDPISIDYGIMEKITNIVLIPGTFGWNDTGSWEALDFLLPKDTHRNVTVGDVLTIESHDNIIASYAPGLIATVGVSNLVIVRMADAILICDKNKTQDIQHVVEQLKKQKKMELV